MSSLPAAAPEPVTIALALDTAYLPWAATLLRSIAQSNPNERVNVHVLNDGSLQTADRDRLTSLGLASWTVAFHDLNPGALAELPTTAEFGPIVWMRLRLPELLPTTARAIYLDSDTFVMGGLRPLWETPLGGEPLGAVANVVEPEARARVRDLGLEYPGGIFNSGVLLLDLDRMRAEGSSETIMEFARRNRDGLRWPDQEALNVALAGRWAPLHPRWNAQNSFWLWRPWALEVFDREALHEAMSAPVIRHFEGPSLSKPWHYLCPYPGVRSYRAALRRTPWGSTALEDRTVGTRLIRPLPMAARIRAYRWLLGRRARPSG